MAKTLMMLGAICLLATVLMFDFIVGDHGCDGCRLIRVTRLRERLVLCGCI